MLQTSSTTSPHAHESAATAEDRSSTTGGTDSALSLLGAAGIGAALMYFLDPERGARRRKTAVDKLVHAGHVTEEALEKAGRDFGNRAGGAAAAARSRFSEDDADDVVIAERVRAELGRFVSHPGAITVECSEGRITLHGAVLAREADELLDRVRGVRGVRDVEDRLEVHQSAEGVPALQGGRPRKGDEFELRQENWTPAARVLTMAAGATLALLGNRIGGAAGAAIGLGGVSLAVRGATNTELERLVGIGGGRRAVDVQKTISIAAPREVVFTFFTDYENWPSFMTHVREVRRTGENGQHWIVDGPAGTTLEWDAEVTRFEQNELVAWNSVQGATVRHAGTMRFDDTADGGTRVHIRMSYNPPAGATGHAIAVLLRADPKHRMDDDLARIKTTIETGTPPRDAARPITRYPDSQDAGEAR